MRARSPRSPAFVVTGFDTDVMSKIELMTISRSILNFMLSPISTCKLNSSRRLRKIVNRFRQHVDCGEAMRLEETQRKHLGRTVALLRDAAFIYGRFTDTSEGSSPGRTAATSSAADARTTRSVDSETRETKRSARREGSFTNGLPELRKIRYEGMASDVTTGGPSRRR